MQGSERQSPVSHVGEMSHGDFNVTWRLRAEPYTPFNITPHLKPVNGIMLLKKKNILALLHIWKCNQPSELQQYLSNVLSVTVVICVSNPEILAEYSSLTRMCLHKILKIRAHIEIFLVS